MPPLEMPASARSRTASTRRCAHWAERCGAAF